MSGSFIKLFTFNIKSILPTGNIIHIKKLHVHFEHHSTVHNIQCQDQDHKIFYIYIYHISTREDTIIPDSIYISQVKSVTSIECTF